MSQYGSTEHANNAAKEAFQKNQDKKDRIDKIFKRAQQNSTIEGAGMVDLEDLKWMVSELKHSLNMEDLSWFDH